MPTDVIAACAAPVTVAAVPETLPVTLPVKLPVNKAEETLVRPASVVLVPPNAIFVDPTVIELYVSAPFGILVKFVPVNVGVLVQDGIAPDTST